MLHVISAGCVARDLHTISPGPLDRTCWRQFATQWGDWKISNCAFECDCYYYYYYWRISEESNSHPRLWANCREAAWPASSSSPPVSTRRVSFSTWGVCHCQYQQHAQVIVQSNEQKERPMEKIGRKQRLDARHSPITSVAVFVHECSALEVNCCLGKHEWWFLWT